MAPTSKIVGTKAALWVKAALNHIGIIVAEPPGDHLRYDLLIILDDGTYRRVQIKNARVETAGPQANAAIRFWTASSNNNNSERKSIRTNYRGQAELFAAYSHYTGKAYLIPVEEVGVVTCTLRLLPPLNDNRANIRFAREYEVTEANKEFILDTIEKTVFSKETPLEIPEAIQEMDLELVEEPLEPAKVEISESDFLAWKSAAIKHCAFCGTLLSSSKKTYCNIGCSNASRAKKFSLA